MAEKGKDVSSFLDRLAIFTFEYLHALFDCEWSNVRGPKRGKVVVVVVVVVIVVVVLLLLDKSKSMTFFIFT